MKTQRISLSASMLSASMLIFCSALVGWVRPELPTKTKPASSFSAQLQQVSIEVNGAVHHVKNGDTLRIVRGDRVRILDGKLNDAGKKIDAINAIGFNSPKSRNGDDRKIEFSSFSFQAEWSENKLGDTFVAIVSSGNETNGAVYFKLIEPELNYAVLDVNGREVVLRSGEPFVGASSDQVRVKRVVTNVTDNDNVFVQMVPIKGRDGEYEMRFLREKLIFAKLPLKLEK